MGKIGLTVVFLVGMLVCFVHGEKTEGHDWGYYNKGVADDEKPETWKDFFPQCGGESQSPVHIYKDKVEYDEDLGDITFDGYDKVPDTNFTMENNGHTLVFGVNSEHYISNGGLDGKYKLAQFHLHWGSGNNNGSEHWIDDKHYAAEIHLVHYNTKYDSLGVAADKDDGLAVLGSIISVEGEDNENMADIVRHLADIPYADSPKVQVKPFPLIQAFPSDHKVFYRYPGSLTTPPCYESVTWTVFENHISISQAQIDHLRNELHHSVEADTGTSEDYQLVDNHRPPQPIGERSIKVNVPQDATSDGAAANAARLMGLTGVMLLLTMLLF